MEIYKFGIIAMSKSYRKREALSLPNETVLFQIKMLFQNPKYFESKMLIHGHIIRIVGFQRNHQLMLLGVPDHLYPEEGCQAVMPHIRPHCQVDDVKTLCLMK